jgi:hypothetical protein
LMQNMKKLKKLRKLKKTKIKKKINNLVIKCQSETITIL